MYFEVYDVETRNVLIDADSLAEVLAVVRATVRKHESDAVATWMLVEDDNSSTESGRLIATGEALVRLAAKPQVAAAPRHD